jgi:hypothetical protein
MRPLALEQCALNTYKNRAATYNRSSMTEHLLLDSLETIREAVQIPDGYVVGAMPTNGHTVRNSSFDFEPALTARLQMPRLPAADIDRAVDLANAVNETLAPTTRRIEVAHTITKLRWVAVHQGRAVTQAKVVAQHYGRAARRNIIDQDSVDTRRVISQVVAEYLVGRAVTPTLTKRSLGGPEPTTYYNSFEIAALRQEFHEEHIKAGEFLRTLSKTVMRKHHTRSVLALMYDTAMSSAIAYKAYKELIIMGSSRGR